jgi:hypothetical protein
MNSPDCRRMETAHYPHCRGYAGCFLLSAIPIAGEYLEIPSTRGVLDCRHCNGKLSTVAGVACDERPARWVTWCR